MSILSYFDQFPEFEGTKIEIRGDDGYFDATQMGKAMDAFDGKKRKFSNWTRTSDGKRILSKLSKHLGKPIFWDEGSDFPLVDWLTGRGNHIWIHPEVAKEYVRHCTQPQSNYAEKSIEDNLARSIPMATQQVRTAAGVVDIVTPDEIIEVKHIKNWKCAVGQVMVYQSYFPGKKRRIHLFGDTATFSKSLIQKHCSKLNIAISWEAE